MRYSDTTVNKKMKALIKLFYQILFKCNNWNQLKIDNKNNLLLNFFSKNKHFSMISDREEAHATGAFNAPKNIKNGSVVKKLSQKNLGVSNEL